jgi:transcriptional regulator with XRE-family HTH domain
MSLPKNLKTLRRSINWTQKQAASNLGITLCRYQSYEEFRAEPNICTLVKIARLFNVTVDQLVDKEIKIKMNIEVDGKDILK